VTEQKFGMTVQKTWLTEQKIGVTVQKAAATDQKTTQPNNFSFRCR
jgi:hypothetical protein